MRKEGGWCRESNLPVAVMAGPSSIAFSGTFLGSWVGIGAAGPATGALIGDLGVAGLVLT